MPIEVRELVIRATVEQGRNQGAGRTGTQSSGQTSSDSNDCLTKMEEIKKMLQEKNER
jgi:hypothetical protein